MVDEVELVIKIPREQHSLIMQSHRSGVERFISKEAMMYAIKNGTPLPKGHGDLIDKNDLLEFTDINMCAYTPTISRYDIITADTIVEANTESEE